MGNYKKYHLLYLPTGHIVEILGPSEKTENRPIIVKEWHKLSKSRQDLKKVLIRILSGKVSIAFYKHNEMLKPPVLKECHFIFQKSSKLTQIVEIT